MADTFDGLDPRRPTRRVWLASAASVALAVVSRSTRGDEPDRFVGRSQPLPQPAIVLPTDALPPPPRDGPPRRIAAVATLHLAELGYTPAPEWTPE